MTKEMNGLHRQFMQDEQRFPEPHRYSPERFMDNNSGEDHDPLNIVFGFGRR